MNSRFQFHPPKILKLIRNASYSRANPPDNPLHMEFGMSLLLVEAHENTYEKAAIAGLD